MRQSHDAKLRNKHYSSRMKSMVKLVLQYVHDGEVDKAKAVLPEVFKSIDLAAKKNIIHVNNAAHKKSRVQKAVTMGVAKPVEAKATPKKEVKKAAPKAVAKKVEKAENKEEVKNEEKAEA